MWNKLTRTSYAFLFECSKSHKNTHSKIASPITLGYNVIQGIIFKGEVMGVTSIRLQSEVEGPLESLAIKLDRSKNYIINQAIKEFIERKSIEEQRWTETLVAIESVKSGNLVEEGEVNEWLESWGAVNELKPPKT